MSLVLDALDAPDESRSGSPGAHIQYRRVCRTEWTRGPRAKKMDGMPLPATAITRLSDHAGAYVIHVTCARCRHAREVEPRALANILGWNSTLQQACARLRCSKCQAREVNVEIAFHRRPRGWRSNPS